MVVGGAFMDKKYNVDDILSEIKNRKLREKSGQSAQQPGLYRLPQENMDDSREYFQRPHSPPEGKEDEQRPPRRRPDRAEEAPIEEMKLDFGTPKRRGPVQHAPQRTQAGDTAPDFGQFHFEGNAQEQVTPPAHQSPLNFDGHVRSITDKARLRPGRSPLNRPASARPMDADRQSTTDFTPFRPQDTTEHTRVLPQLDESRELNLEELQSGFASQYADEYGEDYQDDAPLASSIDFSEYNSVSDRRDVARDIARTKLFLVLRCALTFLLSVVLFCLAFSLKYEQFFLPSAIDPEKNMFLYMLVNTIATVLVALVNSSAVGGGLISLFRMRSNSDTLAALCILAAIGQGVTGVLDAQSIQLGSMNLHFCVAALSMLFGIFGKLTMINRIQQNFRIISSDKEKKAVLTLDADEMCRDLAGGDSRRPTVVYSAQAGFFTDFLALSYSDKYDVGINRAVAPICLGGALLVGCATYFLTGSVQTAITALAAILCVCATLSATFVENIPLGKLTKKLAQGGGMVSGNKAVEDFCDTRGIILTDNDLFPEGNVQLRGIKSFSQGRIDEAILDAASVICAIDGALAPVFLGIIGGNKKLLRRVDNIVCEPGMGVSAWVNSRRVLVGNRKLMQHHGAILPESPEQKYAKDPGEAIYVSNSGEVSARFVIGYLIDEDLAAQLDLLALRDVVLTVHTADANLTPHKLWELYGYPEEQILILPAKYQQVYESMSAPRETAVAEICYTGKAAAMVGAILACMNARSSILAGTVISLIQMILGYGVLAFMSFMGTVGDITFVQLCLYQIFWFLAVFLVQKLRHP